jgi:hypothetical protein
VAPAVPERLPGVRRRGIVPLFVSPLLIVRVCLVPVQFDDHAEIVILAIAVSLRAVIFHEGDLTSGQRQPVRPVYVAVIAELQDRVNPARGGGDQLFQLGAPSLTRTLRKD